MNAQEFAYWLQGYVELGGEQPTPEQWAQIKDHLQLVFKKVTPVRTGPEYVPFQSPKWADMEKLLAPRPGDLSMPLTVIC